MKKCLARYMCRLFETIRIENGGAVSLCWHQRRVAEVSAVELAPYISRLFLPAEGVYKLRIDYDARNGITGSTLREYAARPVRTLKKVRCDTVSYPRKYAVRDELDELRAMRGGCDDVLIIKDGCVTDVSYANILFSENGKWYTPDTPLLPGTCRARLLSEGAVCERRITEADICLYDMAMLVNAMLPFDEARAFPVSGII